MTEHTDFYKASTDARTGIEMWMLDRNQLDHYWEGICKSLDRVPHTWEDFTKEFFYEAAKREHMQVWVIGDPAIRLVLFSQVANYPARRKFEILWAYGSGIIREAAELVFATLSRFAATHNCAIMHVEGRLGWERALAPYGFKRRGAVLTYALVNERLHS